MATIESVVAESERQIWLLLGRWGILHVLRSGAKDAIDDAISRGVEIKIVACIDKKTIRFFDSLDDKIEIRHHEDFNLNGVFVDEEVGIQFVHTEDNPTGRGKEDTAILIESGMLLTAQSELLKIQWKAAKSYKSIRSKILDGVMTEPLRLSLGEGSFYEHFRNSLLQGMTVKSTSNATLRKNGSEVKFGTDIESESLSALGIDSTILFEHIGTRIGQELAVKLQHISEDSKFWETIAKEWSDMGMGEIETKSMPPTKVIVKDGSACGGNPNTSKFFCNLDESVISGILLERHGKKVSTTKRDCMDSKNCSCFYEIICEE
jgi:predicted hydrocarbon binding protein